MFLLKKYQDHIPCSFAQKLVSLDDKFTTSIVVFRNENAAYKFIKAILKEYQYCKNTKKHFNKNLILSEKEGEQFQPNNFCWIYEKLFDDENEKVRDYCHVTNLEAQLIGVVT